MIILLSELGLKPEKLVGHFFKFSFFRLFGLFVLFSSLALVFIIIVFLFSSLAFVALGFLACENCVFSRWLLLLLGSRSVLLLGTLLKPLCRQSV